LSPTDREVAVVSDFLIEQGLSPNGGPYVFQEKTIVINGFPDGNVSKEVHEKVPASLIADCVRKNAAPSRLTKALTEKFSVRILNAEEEARQFPKDSNLNHDWKSFHKKYPHSGGLYAISRVGFSKDGCYAMLCFEKTYASLGGECNVFVLKWNPQKAHWDKADLEFNLWIA